jgi:hypothetical protein
MRRRTLTLIAALAAAGAARVLHAQADKPAFTPEELDQMLAPIGLYPDSLLSQVLMASGYPLEVVEAARWSKANPSLKGMDAVAATQGKSWDTSVKSLVAFPDLLGRMNEHLDWTQKLGDAMIDQQQDVADSIQRLRRRAAAAGNLKSTPQQTVTTEGSGDTIQYIITPASPEIVYVPAYDPAWAYGTWPYPTHPPVYHPVAGALLRGFFWGVGFAAAGALFGGWHWGHGNSYVNVNINRAVSIDNSFNRTKIAADGRWPHDPAHRKGVGYRGVSTRQQFGQRTPGADQRQQFRGRAPQTGAVQRPAPRPNAVGGVGRGQEVNRESARGHQQVNRAQSHGKAPAQAQAPGGGAKGDRR